MILNQRPTALMNGLVQSALWSNYRPILNGLGDVTDPNTDSISQLVQAGILAWNTQTIAQANAERAAKGLPPLDPSAYAPTVNVGLSSQTMIMVAGIGVLALFMMSQGRGGRR